MRPSLKRRLAWSLGALVLAAAGLVALGLALIDTPAARAEIQRRLAQALGGQVSWEALDIGLLPAPHGELRKVRIEMPGRLSAATDELNVGLRFWPLLRGRAEISSVTVIRPQVRIVPPKDSGSDATPDAVALYRAALEPVARALQEFAPDMTFRLAEAQVDVAPLQLRGLSGSLDTKSEGFELELTSASNFWKHLSLKGRVGYADLAARADFDLDAGELAAVKGTLLVPAGKPPQLAAELSRVDVAQTLAIARRNGAQLDVIEAAEGKLAGRLSASVGPPWQLQLDVVKSDAAVKLAPLPWKLAVRAAQVTVSPDRVGVAGLAGSLGESSFSGMAAQVDFGNTPRLSAASGRATLHLEQWFAWLQTKLPLEAIASASGSVDVTLNRLALRFDRPAAADFEAVATPRGVTAALKALPAPVRIAGGTIHADAKRVRVAGLSGALGNSTFSEVAAQIDLGTAPRLSSASGRATLQLEQWFPWLRTKVPLEEIESLSGSVDVALTRLALRFDRPAEVDFDATATPQKVSATLKMLPAPVSVAGGSLRAGREKVSLEKLAVAMLDARALVSGTVGIQKPAIELAITDGFTGEKLLRWALERGAVPPRLEPRTPLRFAAQRIAWAPQGALEADARIDFEGGPALALALAWRPELLELRRLAIKDATSDAVLSATVGSDLIQAGFSGRLQGRSIAAMLRQPPPSDSGSAQGELRFIIDQAQPQRSVAEGQLRVEALDLSWLAGKRAIVERIDLSAGKTTLRIADARLDWEEQRFGLRGEVRRTDAGPVIEARIESPGVLLDRLLPPPDPNAPKKPASAIWPLPVSGRVEVSSGFVQYKDYRIEPFAGNLRLEPQRARLEVKEARMCGVSFPLEVEAQPEQTIAAAHIRMQNEPLERAVRCLTGGNVELTGTADLSAELHTRGQRPHLLRDLTGTLQADVRQGRVKKFALLGNILSYRGIAALGEKQDGFPYRRMTAKGHFQGGALMLEEAFFDSDAVRLAASGRVDLLQPNSQLTVLVGLLTHVDRIAGAIPIIGDIFGGSMTALPMSVSGDIRDPLIVPLGPRAVTDQLLGIFERTLKLPGKLLVPPEAKPSP